MELNEAQRRAATTSGQSVLVMAGAGTGKTATLIARCKYLIEEGVNSTSIQALAFTRRAAQEIKERVRSSLGARADGLGASTFHSWCTRRRARCIYFPFVVHEPYPWE